MAEKIIGKVTIKVVPEVDNHRPDMERDMERQLDRMERRSKRRKPIKVEVEIDADKLEDSLDNALDDANRDADKRKLTLKMAFDYDDVLRGTEQIRAALKQLERDKNTVTVELNEDALNDKLDVLTKQLSSTPVHMRMSDDIDGARQVLKKIEAIRKQASEIELTFKTDPKSLDKLEKDIKKKYKELAEKSTAPVFKIQSELDRDSLKKALAQVEKAKRDLVNPPLLIQTNMDMAGLNKAEKEIRSQLFKTPIKLRYDPNSRDSILGAIKELRKDIKEDPIGIELEINNPNQGSVKAKMAQLQRQIDEIDSTINLEVDYSDQDSLKRARKAIEEALKKVTAKPEDLAVRIDEASLLKARQRLESFIEDENNSEVDINVNPTGIALAAARLSYLTRPRTVSIIAKVDAKSLAIAAGMLKSLSGLGVLQRLGNTVESVVRNFDKFAVKSTAWMGAIGNLVNVLGYMGTSLFTIGGGISQVIGLAALLPTLAASSAAVFTVLTMGFNNFAQSFSDVPIVAEQALAKLPPAARKARDAMAGLWTEIRDPVQNLFWETLGTSLQDFANRVVPEIGRGLLMITPAVARFTKNVLSSFEEIARNGQMKTMFKNLSTGFDNLGRGAKPFFDALNTLGLRGSEFLPRMGDALADMAEDFDEWIRQADKAGDINRWIEDGIQSLKDMAGVVSAVSRQFKALTQIIDAGGGAGLDGFRKSMEDWAAVMEREPFRSRMVRILRGARDGASELNVGFQKLTGTIGESSETVEALLVLLGRVGSGALERVADVLGRNYFQVGLLSGITKVEVALDRLKPAAENIGDILGTMFDVSGSVILGIVPMLNQVTDILRTITTGLGPTLRDMIPILTGFVGNILALTQGPLQLMADGLKIVVDAVKVLPGPMQNLVVAFASFLALRGRIGGMMTTLDRFWNGQKTTMSNGIATTTTNAAKFQTALDRIPVAITGTTTKVDKARQGLSTAVTKVGGAVKGIGTALGGLVALGGGLGGALLFTGIIAGISAIGEAAKRKQQDIADFRASLDDLGKGTTDTLKVAADWLTTSTVKFQGAKRPIAEMFDSFGIGAGVAAKALSGTTEDFDTFYSALVEREKKVFALGQQRLQDQTFDSNLRTEEQQKITKGYLDEAAAISQALPQLKNYGDTQREAMRQAEIMADAMGISTGNSMALTDAMSKLSSETTGVPGKIDAITTALDILNGGMRSKQEGVIAFADTIRGLNDTIKDAAKQKIDLTKLIGNNGVIDLTFRGDPTGIKAQLYNQLFTGVSQGISDGIRAAEAAPPEGKLAAFRAAYENAIGQIRARIEPQLDGDPAKARAKFDKWLKTSGLDKTTIETVLDGKIEPAEWAKLPPEIQSILQPLLDANPAKVPLDGDYLPLQEKATIASGILEKLGATKTNPKLDADGEPLTKKQQEALAKLRALDKETAIPKLLADGSPLSKAHQKAMRDLLQIDTYEAIPRFDADGKPLDQKTRDAVAKLLGLHREKPTPTLDANGKPLADEVKTSKAKLADVNKQRPNPVMTITTNGLGTVQNALSILRGANGTKYTTTYQITTRYTSMYEERISSGPGGRGGLTFSGFDGAVNAPGSQYRFKPSAHSYFANGGFSKPSSAHIAPAGSYVTYAEKETGGEAFIPLASSKRARSTAILTEVARRFGLQLTRAGKSFADGAVNASGMAGSGGSYSIGQVIIPAGDLAELREITDFFDALQRRARQN